MNDDPDVTMALANRIAKPLLDGDPATPVCPRGLILDLALNTQPVPSLLEDYGITSDEFEALKKHPVFQRELADLRDKLQEEGFSFRVKAQAQAEMYLLEAWKMVHDSSVPASVRSQLIMWTTKVAGLEPKQGVEPGGLSGNMSALAEQLKSLPDGELEMRVMSLIVRNAKNQIQPQVIEAVN